MRLIFVNRFYWPNESATAQLLHDLARHLASRGHEVHVIASDSADSTRPVVETLDGVRIHRVSRHAAKTGVAAKAREFVFFLLGAARALLRLSRRATTVVAMTDPPLLGVMARFVTGLKGARLVNWTQDIYPEIAIRLGSRRLVRASAALLLPSRTLAWRQSDGCVAISEGMAGHLREEGVEAAAIEVIPNWAPRGLSPQSPSAGDRLKRDWELGGKFIVAYSGNLGRVHDLDSILDLAEELRQDAGITLLIVGGGPGRAGLESAVARRTLTNVQFRPAQPRSRLAESLAVADVHLITLRPECADLVFPSKFYGIVQVGRPIAFIGPRDCELARLVIRHRMGLAATPGEIPALAAGLRAWAGHRASYDMAAAATVEFARTQGGAEKAFTAWEALLGRLT
ncbi:MAG: glycosyltransferase family 4 protein [Verrucomicrobiota bacterium]